MHESAKKIAQLHHIGLKYELCNTWKEGKIIFFRLMCASEATRRFMPKINAVLSSMLNPAELRARIFKRLRCPGIDSKE
jgi:hypothetical protein